MILEREVIELQGNTLVVDLSEPRTIAVRGVNTITGEEKCYLLRVTKFGKLILQ